MGSACKVEIDSTDSNQVSAKITFDTSIPHLRDHGLDQFIRRFRGYTTTSNHRHAGFPRGHPRWLWREVGLECFETSTLPTHMVLEPAPLGQDICVRSRQCTHRSLYPFNEGTNVSSKAMMPVGNVPIINLVLDWIIESGLTGGSACDVPETGAGKGRLIDRYFDDCTPDVPLGHLESSRRELLVQFSPSVEDRLEETYGRGEGRGRAGERVCRRGQGGGCERGDGEAAAAVQRDHQGTSRCGRGLVGGWAIMWWC